MKFYFCLKRGIEEVSLMIFPHLCDGQPDGTIVFFEVLLSIMHCILLFICIGLFSNPGKYFVSVVKNENCVAKKGDGVNERNIERMESHHRLFQTYLS